MNCIECGSTEQLVEHHVSYDPEDTVWMCRSCHIKLHGRKKVRPDGFHSTKNPYLIVKIPEKLKLRLDLFVLKNNITIKQAVRELLNDGLPNLEIR